MMTVPFFIQQGDDFVHKTRLAPYLHYLDENKQECRTSDVIFKYKKKKNKIVFKKVAWEQVTDERPMRTGKIKIEKFLEKFLTNEYQLIVKKVEGVPLKVGMKILKISKEPFNYYEGVPEDNILYTLYSQDVLEVVEVKTDYTPYPTVKLLSSAAYKRYVKGGDKVPKDAEDLIVEEDFDKDSFVLGYIESYADSEGNMEGCTLIK